MKKNTFFLLLFSLFFFPFNSYALSFTDCNNEQHNVIDYTTLRDYCYFNYFDSSSSSLIVFNRSHNEACIIGKTGTDFYYDTSENYLKAKTPATAQYKYIQIYNLDMIATESDNAGVDNLIFPAFSFSNIDIYNNDDTIKFASNFTINEIKNKYNCSSVEPEEPEPEEPEPEEPEPEPDRIYPINTNDYYLGIVLFSLLIWLLYFKWCFPMKGGKKL